MTTKACRRVSKCNIFKSWILKGQPEKGICDIVGLVNVQIESGSKSKSCRLVGKSVLFFSGTVAVRAGILEGQSEKGFNLRHSRTC